MPLPDVFIYKTGLVHCSVCVPAEMTREAVEQGTNTLRPTGVSSLWKISKAEAFSGGEPNPSPCKKDDRRVHYLMEC